VALEKDGENQLIDRVKIKNYYTASMIREYPTTNKKGRII
jgi:hypothetical protein